MAMFLDKFSMLKLFFLLEFLTPKFSAFGWMVVDRLAARFRPLEVSSLVPPDLATKEGLYPCYF
jgi:hypothetical protein